MGVPRYGETAAVAVMEKEEDEYIHCKENRERKKKERNYRKKK
jgi:hypothetical protein